MRAVLLTLLTSAVFAADYAAPAGVRPAQVRPGAESILPGGRAVTPLGRSYTTGSGPFGLAISPSGKLVATANGGPDGFSLTVLRRDKMFWFVRQVPPPAAEEQDWRGVSRGIAFENDGALYVSEGESGRVRAVDAETGERRRVYDVNTGGAAGSHTGDLALDRARGMLYVVDQANSRLVVIDVRRHQVTGSVRLGPAPFAIALSADGRKAYVTNLGGPGAPETNSLAIVDLENPAAPRVEALVPIGDPLGVAVAPGAVYVSNARNDSITVIDSATGKVRGEIELRIPGLESLRGVAPMGLAYAPNWNWLLVAEAGINAVGVIDLKQGRVLGHVPAGWFPARVLVDREMVYVSNAKGQGTGPNSDRALVREAYQGVLRRGSVTIFPLSAAGEIESLTAQTLANNGFLPREKPATELPQAIRRVVLIVKENRTFDEVLGDVERASNGPVESDPALARLGRHGNVTAPRGGPRLRQRLPILMAVNVTPNHHELAARWAFSDNFYADSDAGFEEGLIVRHLDRHGVSSRTYGEGLDKDVPDQARASQFIAEVERKYVKGGEPFPRLIVLRLPQDHLAQPRPEDGYPYEASYMADNDYALGRILEYLSSTPWWRETAVFVVGSGADGGVDHVDSHRTLLFVAGPYAKKNYVSHVNASVPALLKTVFRLLGVPPLNLYDAAASDLSDCFTAAPDFAPYQALKVDPRLFDPEKVRGPVDTEGHMR